MGCIVRNSMLAIQNSIFPPDFEVPAAPPRPETARRAGRASFHAPHAPQKTCPALLGAYPCSAHITMLCRRSSRSDSGFREELALGAVPRRCGDPQIRNPKSEITRSVAPHPARFPARAAAVVRRICNLDQIASPLPFSPQ